MLSLSLGLSGSVLVLVLVLVLGQIFSSSPVLVAAQFSDALVSFSPLFLPILVDNIVINVTASSPSDLSGAAMLALVPDGSTCDGDRAAVTSLASGGPIFSLGDQLTDVGEYRVCYTPDGTTWCLQTNIPVVQVLVAGTESFQWLYPDVIVMGDYPKMTFAGLVPMPTAVIAFSRSSSCDNLCAETTFATSNTMELSTTPPFSQTNAHKICFSTDGGKTMVAQTNIILFVISNDCHLNDISPDEFTVGELPVFCTNTHVNTSTTMIAFTLTNCTAPNMVGETRLLQRNSFQLGSEITEAGNYAICFSTDNGTAYTKHTSLTIAVIDVPSPPLNVVVLSSTGSTFHVDWDEPLSDGNSPIQSYIIEAVDVTTPSITTSVTVAAPTTVGVIGVARALHEYNVTVRAVNKVGESDRSSPALNSTGGATVAGPITKMTVASHSTILSLSWTPPFETGGEGIDEYQLNVYIVGSSNLVTSLSSETDSVDIGSLAPSTRYNITIAAVNGIGVGSKTYFIFSTEPGKVPGPPTNLTLLATTTTSLSISWQPPEFQGLSNDTVSGYNVTYVRQGADYDTGPRTTFLTKATVVISNLATGASYNVTVMAINPVGGSKDNPTCVLTTESLGDNVLQWMKDNYVYVILIVVAIVLFLLAAIVYCYARQKKKKRYDPSSEKGGRRRGKDADVGLDDIDADDSARRDEEYVNDFY